MQLTPDQQNALDKIVSWAKGQKEQEMTLSGYAGTGKTTLILSIIDALKNTDVKVQLTATTNKAAKVLAVKAKTEATTIHSLLKLRMVENGTQKVLKEAGEPELPSGITVIDECSMIDSLLFSYIQKGLKNPNAKVLYVGDPAQLPPINERISKSFTIQNIVTLTEIVRYAGPILEAATHIRTMQARGISVYLSQLKSWMGSTLNVIHRNDLSKLLDDKFTGDDYQNNPDFARFLAYKNETVDSINWDVRQRLGFRAKDLYEPGDRIMAKAPVIRKYKVQDPTGTTNRPRTVTQILMMNSEEGIVTSSEVMFDQYSRLGITTESRGEIEIRVLFPPYMPIFNQKLKELADQKFWSKFWELKEAYADVQFAHAMTTHKSQGSTFNHVIIDYDDIMQNQNLQERNQLLYVALTRASETVTFITSEDRWKT